MVDDEDESPRIQMTDTRRWNWFLAALVAVNTAEDVVDAFSQGLGNLRCQMVGHVRWSESNDRLLAEIESLPTVGDADR